MRAAHVYNLEVLHRAGVRLALGSDLYQGTSPRAIFPDRKIGHLQSGFEASFLVLDGNLLESLSHLRSISARYHRGVRLTSDP